MQESLGAVVSKALRKLASHCYTSVCLSVYHTAVCVCVVMHGCVGDRHAGVTE